MGIAGSRLHVLSCEIPGLIHWEQEQVMTISHPPTSVQLLAIATPGSGWYVEPLLSFPPREDSPLVATASDRIKGQGLRAVPVCMGTGWSPGQYLPLF